MKAHVKRLGPVLLQEACQMMLYASYTHQKALLYLPNAGSIHKSQNKKANETEKSLKLILKVNII